MDSPITRRLNGRVEVYEEHFTRGSTHGVKKNELKPWLNKEWCIPPLQNGDFVCHMEDVLEVYQRAYDPKRPVVCMDELSKQLTKETRQPIAAGAGRVERYDTEYERNGTANIFLYIEPLRGTFVTTVTHQRTKPDWAATIKEIVDRQYPDVEKIVLVMDNLNTHTGASLYESFEPQEARRLLDKLEIHHTPKHGSWLNIAEIGLSMLSGQCLDRRIPDMATLTQEVVAWTTKTNTAHKKVDWQFTTADARIKLKRLYPTITT